MPSILWKRNFIRSAVPDQDVIVDEQFRKTHFTDLFGQFIQQGYNAKKTTFHDLVSAFYDNEDYTLNTFAVADGAFIEQSKVPGDWFDPHLRFVSLVRSKNDEKGKIFIVGPGDVKNPNRFLQVASWDGTTFRFYAVETINKNESNKAWTYQGSSFDAFSDDELYDSSYIGPFNGHVNGACIMKELNSPWYHWYSGKHGNFWASIPEADQKVLKTIPYLADDGSFSKLGEAYILEGIIRDTVTDWYATRLASDFSKLADNKRVPKSKPTNIHRWISHLLLTTTINIQTSQFNGQTYSAPPNLFFNEELFSKESFDQYAPDTDSSTFQFDIDKYEKARDTLRLSLLHEVRENDKTPKTMPHLTLKRGTLGGGKETASYDLTTFIEVAPKTEGIPFVVLQPSFEDVRGIMSMNSLQSDLGGAFPTALLSEKALHALLILDFWNPIYSWRRGVLMQYLPKETTLTNNGKEYDLEANFIDAIRKSSFATNKDKDSPENQLLELYDKPEKMEEHQQKLESYISAVTDRLQTEEGILDYLKLAESRRRMYRPLPLDEFGVQLPYAVNLPPEWQYIEMTETAETQEIPKRGLDFLNAWIGTLHGYDPHIVPDFKKIPGQNYLKPHAARCPRTRPGRESEEDE